MNEDTSEMDLEQRRDYAYKTATENAGWGSCSRCALTWNLVPHDGYIVMCSKGSGMFALCDICFFECDVEERTIYFKQVWDSWKALCSSHPAKIREDCQAKLSDDHWRYLCAHLENGGVYIVYDEFFGIKEDSVC